MGMFDAPRYLTGGDNPYVTQGGKFWLHGAEPGGMSNLNGKEREQVKLTVSRSVEGDQEIVFTSGMGIVNQIKRMNAADRAALPMHVMLSQVPSGKGNPTHVLEPVEIGG